MPCGGPLAATSTTRCRAIDAAPPKPFVLISPIVSKAMHDETALEVAALEMHSAQEVFRLAFNGLVSDWRRDPGVTVEACVQGTVSARRSIPAILDGEIQRLPRRGRICVRPLRLPRPGPARPGRGQLVSLRIAHLSDIHFGGENKLAVEAALAAVAPAALAPTLTMVTGDLTLNGLPQEFLSAHAWLDRLPAERIVTPGNHDTPYWNLILRTLTPFERYRRFIGPAGLHRLRRPRPGRPGDEQRPGSATPAGLVQGRAVPPGPAPD